jgi:hypothetical protein
MFQDLSASNLSELMDRADEVARDAKQTFGELNAEQINWKPDPEQWSVGQCFDHLIKSNQSYYLTLEKIVRREKKPTLWERIPSMPAVWGKLLIKSLDPNSQTRMKAPKIFKPTSSSIDEYVIGRFVEEQGRLIKYMKETSVLDVEKIIISSPVSGLITYSLLDCYRILITHERRHFLQAKRVTEAGAFPR